MVDRALIGLLALASLLTALLAPWPPAGGEAATILDAAQTLAWPGWRAGGLLTVWLALWLRLTGDFIWAYAPFHLLAAWGLYAAGRAAGGRAGGLMVAVLGLSLPGVREAATQAHPAFPLTALGVAALAQALAGRSVGLLLGAALLLRPLCFPQVCVALFLIRSSLPPSVSMRGIWVSAPLLLALPELGVWLYDAWHLPRAPLPFELLLRAGSFTLLIGVVLGLLREPAVAQIIALAGGLMALALIWPQPTISDLLPALTLSAVAVRRLPGWLIAPVLLAALFTSRSSPAPPSAPSVTNTQDQPAEQALYVRMADGTEQGPLLAPASSVEVVQTTTGWVALFVRDQTLWRAEAPDGLRFGAPEATPIQGFDPAVVALPAGGYRLYVVSLSQANQRVDPALHPTEIHSYLSADLRVFTPEPGVRLAGVGVVDPAVEPVDGQLRMLYTQRGALFQALSADGLTFTADPAPVLTDTAVADTAPGGWIIAQRHVAGVAQLVAIDPARVPSPLGVCGTGPAVVGARLYYTRADRPCALAPQPLPWGAP